MQVEMGKMFLATACGFKATEAEAISEGIFGGGELKAVDRFAGKVFDKRVGLQRGSRVGLEKT